MTLVDVRTIFSPLAINNYYLFSCINAYLFKVLSLFFKYFLLFLLFSRGISSSLSSFKPFMLTTGVLWFECAIGRRLLVNVNRLSPPSLELSPSSVIPSLVCCGRLALENGVNWEEKFPEHKARSCELSPSQWPLSDSTLVIDFGNGLLPVTSLKPNSSRTP